MKKIKIWIVNHYATQMYIDKNGRHYNFAKYLDKNKYDVTIICSNQSYNSNFKIEVNNKYKRINDDVKWIFIKTPSYNGNGFKRIYNIIFFYRKLYSLLKTEILPDIIIGSNVHLLSCYFAVKMKKKHKLKCIVEMRDLWPECFIDSKLGRIKPMMYMLYLFEEYLYKNADAIIGTMEGIKDYIGFKYTYKNIEKNKIFYINNGIDLNQFYINENKTIKTNVINDNRITLVYTGTINIANGIENLICLAKKLKSYKNKVNIYVYGSGNYADYLTNKIKIEHIDNIFYKGKVSKEEIPSILKQADFVLLNYGNQSMFRWGESQNKLFEYIASGKPILSNIRTKYDIVKDLGIGIYFNVEDQNSIDKLYSFINMNKKEYNFISEKEQYVIKQYDFKYLTKKLEDVFCYVLDTCESETCKCS